MHNATLIVLGVVIIILFVFFIGCGKEGFTSLGDPTRQCNLIIGPGSCPKPPIPPTCGGFDNILDWMVCFLKLYKDPIKGTSIEFFPWHNPFGDDSPLPPGFYLSQSFDNKGRPKGYTMISTTGVDKSDCRVLKGSAYNKFYDVCAFTSENQSKQDLINVLEAFFKSNHVLSTTNGWVTPSFDQLIPPHDDICIWNCSIPVNPPEYGWYFEDIKKAIANEKAKLGFFGY